MNNDYEKDNVLLDEALPENTASLDKALDMCRLIHNQIHHIQFDRISYVLWSESGPPFRGSPFVAVKTSVFGRIQGPNGCGLDLGR
ncbi:hypothetical protein M427DRAFT_60665 [Gonapodya prolifera JEL478]|uniref:Uncharacterized protein n=1 Tax=Gonapodya prolifera (strain JEL478) TaxID=1344416 RepID=A0A139A3M4_GONPJ|nr:hypothetical protein M427DRAFT_60665 [Gonapodya prolifera JEL478]|eukprot:KXS11416.1 hypothetical protein M427DRAFT_60665 [Gonapodya prolifera JEL478]